jgi:hypothetical protein
MILDFQINTSIHITINHLAQFVDLWTRVSVKLFEGILDKTTWKFTTLGLYTTASAYNYKA